MLKLKLIILNDFISFVKNNSIVAGATAINDDAIITWLKQIASACKDNSLHEVRPVLC